MQDLSDISNLIQLPKQRDLTSPETPNKIKYPIMSTWLAVSAQELWDIYGTPTGLLSDSQRTE